MRKLNYSSRTFWLAGSTAAVSVATVLAEYLRPDDEDDAITKMREIAEQDERAAKVEAAHMELMCARGELSSVASSLGESHGKLEEAHKLLCSADRRPSPMGLLGRLFNQ